jgi:hypothetical protein
MQHPVYERESDYFFQDSSDKIIQDDDLSRLISFHNVFVRYCVRVSILELCPTNGFEVHIRLSLQRKPFKTLLINALRAYSPHTVMMAWIKEG